MLFRTALVGLVIAGCGSGGGFPDAKPVIIDGSALGTFSTSWTITDMAGAPVSCSQIGAQSVIASLHETSTIGGFTVVFSCSTGTGTSQRFATGIYDMTFELDAIGGTLATAPIQRGIEIDQDFDTVVDPLAFSVDATGGLALHITSGKAAGNCAATAAGGAGITSTSISFVHASDGTCAPLTLAVGAGATQPAGSYTINCAAPADGPCIDSDQPITVSGVPSDAYTIHVKSKVGAAECWSNNDSLQVPAAGMVKTSTLNLGFATGTPGC